MGVKVAGPWQGGLLVYVVVVGYDSDAGIFDGVFSVDFRGVKNLSAKTPIGKGLWH